MKKKIKIKKIGIIIILLSVIIALFIGTILYIDIHGLRGNLKATLNGDSVITIEVGKKYKESGVVVKYKDKLLNNTTKIIGKVNENKIGEYEIVYKISYKMLKKEITRKVKVVDRISPELTLEGDNVSVIVGNEYSELGYKANDNYDGDLTSKVEINNNVDTNKIGEYEIVYKVKDSSNNESSKTRKVSVIAKPATNQKIAVLNYHFFYDPETGETCGDGNCKKVADFRRELNWLRDNGYKTLTMTEFRDWMYGKLEIPDKSVLITVDDGAMGTGVHNGNKLIPILEEYKMHATLFLITGWWDINNYNKSQYLEIESHTNDMHNESWCSGVTRGARMLCQSNEEVLKDLATSIQVTGSKKAFCFPFFAYDARTIGLVKEAGFELAFIGGGYKVSRNTDKWHIPRYQIKQGTTLEAFISYVS